MRNFIAFVISCVAAIATPAQVVLVYDATTDRPLPGVPVSSPAGSVVTDLGGTATIPGLLPGQDFVLSIVTPGYAFAIRRYRFANPGEVYRLAVVPKSVLVTPMINPQHGGLFTFPGRGEIEVPPGVLRTPCRISLSPVPVFASVSIGLETEDVYAQAWVTFYGPTGNELAPALALIAPIILRLNPGLLPWWSSQPLSSYAWNGSTMSASPGPIALMTPAGGVYEDSIIQMSCDSSLATAGSAGGSGGPQVDVKPAGLACQILAQLAIVCGAMPTFFSLNIRGGEERNVNVELNGAANLSGSGSFGNEESVTRFLVAKVSGKVGAALSVSGGLRDGTVTTKSVAYTFKVEPHTLPNPCITGEEQVFLKFTIYEFSIDGRKIGTIEIPGAYGTRIVGTYDPSCPGCEPCTSATTPPSFPDPCAGAAMR